MAKIKVAINGYGTIGRRAAKAISLQDDMEVVGVTKANPNYEGEALKETKAFDLYVLANKEKFEAKGYTVKGSLEDLLGKADIVIDCSEEKGKENKKIYEKFPSLKVIFQGGEDEDIGEGSFVAQCNYSKAIGKKMMRNVSCNTTGSSRTINAFKGYGIIEVMMHFDRRTVDPKNSSKGPVNAYAVEVNSHHADDVKTVIEGVGISSNATKGPVTEMHVHTITIDLEEELSKEEAVKLLRNTERVKLVKSSDGFKTTAEIREYGRIARPFGDIYETVIWEDKVCVEKKVRKCKGQEQKFTRVTIAQAIHQEADVVPEIVDLVRAMFNLMPMEESIKKTNSTLGIETKGG